MCRVKIKRHVSHPARVLANSDSLSVVQIKASLERTVRTFVLLTEGNAIHGIRLLRQRYAMTCADMTAMNQGQPFVCKLTSYGKTLSPSRHVLGALMSHVALALAHWPRLNCSSNTIAQPAPSPCPSSHLQYESHDTFAASRRISWSRHYQICAYATNDGLPLPPPAHGPSQLTPLT